MSMLGVAEAAVELAVSPRRVRQMLADGVLAGERVGRAWVIDANDLRQVGHRRPEVGRPWSPASAWAVLASSTAITSKIIFIIVSSSQISRQACPCGKTFQTSRRQAYTCRH